MATSQFRSYHEEALWHASKAEELLKESNPVLLKRGEIHATLAVAYSNIGDQS